VEEIMESFMGAIRADGQPAKAPDLGTISPTNPALHDYQLQLMLLEQQNKKRLMMARQQWTEENNEPAPKSPGDGKRSRTVSHRGTPEPSSPRTKTGEAPSWQPAAAPSLTNFYNPMSLEASPADDQHPLQEASVGVRGQPLPYSHPGWDFLPPFRAVPGQQPDMTSAMQNQTEAVKAVSNLDHTRTDANDQQTRNGRIQQVIEQQRRAREQIMARQCQERLSLQAELQAAAPTAVCTLGADPCFAAPVTTCQPKFIQMAITEEEWQEIVLKRRPWVWTALGRKQVEEVQAHPAAHQPDGSTEPDEAQEDFDMCEDRSGGVPALLTPATDKAKCVLAEPVPGSPKGDDVYSISAGDDDDGDDASDEDEHDFVASYLQDPRYKQLAVRLLSHYCDHLENRNNTRLQADDVCQIFEMAMRDAAEYYAPMDIGHLQAALHRWQK
jgi:hypothetical protein